MLLYNTEKAAYIVVVIVTEDGEDITENTLVHRFELMHSGEYGAYLIDDKIQRDLGSFLKWRKSEDEDEGRPMASVIFEYVI